MGPNGFSFRRGWNNAPILKPGSHFKPCFSVMNLRGYFYRAVDGHYACISGGKQKGGEGRNV